MSDPVTVKRNDTGRRWGALLVETDGQPVDLSGKTVSIIIRNSLTGALVRKAEAQVIDSETAEVGYDPVAADVEASVTLNVEWETVDGSGKITTYPKDSYHRIKIVDDLG